MVPIGKVIGKHFEENMGRKKTGLEDRILRTADTLFYRKGYTNTGISQIVEEAGTNKPGLYSYFEGKEELARRYITARDDQMNARIIAIGVKAADVYEFFRGWMEYTKELAKGRYGPYNGCAVANFASQTDVGDVGMQEFIKDLGRRWAARLTAFIRSEMKAGKFSSSFQAKEIARRMLICNEGAIAMWKLTGSIAYFDEAIAMFEMSMKKNDSSIDRGSFHSKKKS